MSRSLLKLPTGLSCAAPVMLFLLAGFVVPLIMVVGYAFATPKSFEVFNSFSLANFAAALDPSGTVWTSFVWSIGLAMTCTVLLAIIAYPIAYGLNYVFGKWSSLVSILFVFPLFISENVRLYGWVQFFIKGGVIDGALKFFGIDFNPDVLYSPEITLFGMVYVYLPFMLFPMTLGLSMVPQDLIDAAADLGAGRLLIWREVQLPLAMPGILIGLLLTFVLSVGAVAEAKILGGQSVITVVHDIEIAFTYAQNWPMGAALALILVLIIGSLTLWALSKVDLDRMLGGR
ncbi:TPA: ABC transporter permease [Pseudomonas aeruginosa]|nr:MULTISPECIES: ABC transporter permease [Pseudomonas]HCL2803454.1 ABC transporter permease [Pseudomonas aeruginosa 7D9A]ALY59467.1 spermidine/putrescine ABC transporter permease [Pseudomonas aeruginosa]ALY74258.1 spermidine/putrescine ABC transporter permease [Pseudomonas aeruginosa]ALY77379.1 spermidine/putrescine ABC transporter permease [Pseudomonas aeruginosa]ALY85360.1 spermidine/putrescine ABC transporter permease [Pseudomonas aeruginosa]